MYNEHQQNELYQPGEVVERKPNFECVIRLDDSRVLSHCFISRMEIGRRANIEALLPKVGERVWVEESPYDPGYARILINKKSTLYVGR